MKPENIQTPEDIRLWVTKHEAETCACRMRHDKFGDDIERDVVVLKKKVDAIDKKIWFASGAYVFAGWMLTWIVPMIVSHVTGP